MSNAKSHDGTPLTKSLGSYVYKHAEFIASLPAGEFHCVSGARSVVGVPFADLGQSRINRLRARNALEKVEKRKHDGSPYHIWRVPADVQARAEETVANRTSPCGCGHTGIRNLGDSWYSCTNDDCDVRVRRSEVSLDE